MRIVLFAALAAVAVGFTAPAIADEAKQDFRLVNRTGYELKEIYVSPSKSDDWQEDILGKEVLEDGKAANIHFSRQARTCNWDLKVVYTDDSSKAVWSDIDLCAVEKITIHYDRKSDVTRASFD
jgi:hypothetical protein